MNEALVESVLEEAMSRLEQNALPTALLIGQTPKQPLGYQYTDHAPYSAVVIGSLTAGELLHFHNDAVLEALLVGIPVLLNEGGLLYRSHRSSANRLLWAKLQEAERQLLRYGVQLAGAAPAKKLITARDARQLAAQHRAPPEGAVLTPLARDILEGTH